MNGATTAFSLVERARQGDRAETLLRAFRGMAGFTYRGPGSFLAWLASIAGQAIIDAERYQGRARRDGGAPVRLRSATNPNGPEPVDTKTPSRVVARKQEAAAVVEKLNALPEPYRQAEPDMPDLAVRGHFFVRVRLEAERLRAAALEKEWVRKQPVAFVEDAELLLIAPTTELQRWMTQHAATKEAWAMKA